MNPVQYENFRKLAGSLGSELVDFVFQRPGNMRVVLTEEQMLVEFEDEPEEPFVQYVSTKIHELESRPRV